MTFAFERKSGFENKISKTGIVVTTENNTWCNTGLDFMDGDVTRQFEHTGEMVYVELSAEKYVYRSINGACRDRPYNEILAEQLSGQIFKKCSKPCRPKGWYCVFGYAVDNLPICETAEALKCFHAVKRSAMKGILDKPCTKMQYNSNGARWILNNKNQAAFKIEFQNPPKVTVHEEYLIYDFLAMISGIGGTLGLCIGFSFNELVKWIWALLVRYCSLL